MSKKLSRPWRYLISISTRGLCSYSARLLNDDVTVIEVSYWRRREFPNYARLHRGRMCSIALWGWFSCDVLPVTCCEHGHPSIATVHFWKFYIETNILFNLTPFNPVKKVFGFSWQLFICAPRQPVHSSSAITLATMKWAENCSSKSTLLSPLRHVFHTARETMIISYNKAYWFQ